MFNGAEWEILKISMACNFNGLHFEFIGTANRANLVDRNIGIEKVETDINEGKDQIYRISRRLL